MGALKNVRNLNLPDSYIAAGAIRNTVWNYIHNYPTISHQKDIDVAYFDTSDMEGKKEKLSEEILKRKLPNFEWDVVNQARAHLFGLENNVEHPQVKSSCESIAYWSEIPTCVGVRLEDDDTFKVCAPHGLDGLMSLIVEPVPKPYQELSLYKKRVASKNWAQIWPKLKIY